MARQFIRHPVNIPIEVSESSYYPNKESLHVFNVGFGGLAFQSKQVINLGTIVYIKIAYTQPIFEAMAKVIWCRTHQDGAELGVEFFNSDDAFMARMVEQICYIETYKNEVSLKEGRTLTTEGAALEWVSKYAANFPNPSSLN